MSKAIIILGDATSHGGVVISASTTRSIGGKGIARKGDNVSCPLKYPNKKPHGVNAIVEGDDSYLIDGIPVALHGHATECGCTLIGSSTASVG